MYRQVHLADQTATGAVEQGKSAHIQSLISIGRVLENG
jgi:hypothetical protein